MKRSAVAQLLLQVEAPIQDVGIDVGVHGHVGFFLLVAEEERVCDGVGVEAFFDQVAFALLEGPGDLQDVLWTLVVSEMGD